MNMKFESREKLSGHIWNDDLQRWERPDIESDDLKRLNRRSAANGMFRLVVHTLLIVAAAWLTLFAARFNLILSLIPFLFLSFLMGFLNGIEHELRHNIVFPKTWDRFSNFVFFLIHILYKDGSRYQRASHRIHHRFTMIRGVDPETDYPEVITVKWLRMFLFSMLFDILTLGSVSLLKAFWILLKRMAGKTNPLVLAHCSEKDKQVIKAQSFVILVVNLAAAVLFIMSGEWFLFAVLMLAPRIGLAFVAFWFHTEHLGMMYNSTDQRLATRGVKVSAFVKFLYGGLDEHIEHHLFPAVPSRNLTELRKTIDWDLPERENAVQCWKEIFAIARHFETSPEDVFLPEGVTLRS